MFFGRPPLPHPYLNTVGAINMFFFLLSLQGILDLRIYWVYRVYKIYRSLLFTSSIPFLDILIKRCPNNTFATSIYRKKTFTGLYTKCDSFTPRKYKINLIRTLTYRCYRICSSAFLLKSALDDLRKLLLQTGYPHGIITYNINEVLNRNRIKPNSPVSTVPKKDIVILLPYLGVQSV